MNAGFIMSFYNNNKNIVLETVKICNLFFAELVKYARENMV